VNIKISSRLKRNYDELNIKNKFETQKRLEWTKDQHVSNQKDRDELKLKISLRPERDYDEVKIKILETQKR